MEPAMNKTRCALVQMQGEEWVLGVETILEQVHQVVEMADVMPVVEQLTHCLDTRDRDEKHDRYTEDSTTQNQKTYPAGNVRHRLWLVAVSFRKQLRRWKMKTICRKLAKIYRRNRRLR